MAITYDKLMGFRSDNVRHSYRPRETMLYALGIGMGRDPTDMDELPFVFEHYGLRTVPTQAIVVARHNLIYDVGMDVTNFLHGEQRLTLQRSLPPSADLLADAWIAEVFDKGPGKGCIIQIEGRVRDASDDGTLFSWSSLIVARGDGGIGGPGAKAPAPHPMPTRAPDMVHTAETRPDQALLYRLNGDHNLIHADPVAARQVGFRAPILHGACTYGIACREILAHVCGYDPALIRTVDVRFTAPIYPGEHLETHIWVDGGTVAFRSRSPERNVTVLDHGRCELGPAA